MRWEDERYVRVYTRDTVDWLGLSFDAQALMCLLLRKVDRAGILVLGKHGLRAVAISIGHPQLWPRLETALQELVDDGCVRVDGDRLVVPNFIEAQEAKQSDKLRQAERRARAREVSAQQGDLPLGPQPEKKPRTEKPPLPFRAAEALEIIAAAANGRFVASNPGRQAIEIERIVKDHPDRADWEEVGRHLAAGGEKYADVLDSRWVTRRNFDAALGRARAMAGTSTGESDLYRFDE